MSQKELFVVVRHVNERSLPLCVDALQKQTNNFTLISETPFVKAVTKTFEEGIRSKARFLLALDADVILYDGAIKKIIEKATELLSMNPSLFKVDFLVDDQFMGKIFAGCHLYVNQHSPKFLDYFRHVLYDPKEVRPESRTIRLIRTQHKLAGYSYGGETVGRHDFEQYYHHLYFKYYNRAIKKGAYVPDPVVPGKNKLFPLNRIKERLLEHPDNMDCVVALAGLNDGINKELCFTDASSFRNIDWLLEHLDIQEKSPLA